MNNPYQHTDSALKYIDFLNSKNGEIQKQVLTKAISEVIPENPDIKILDAGAGPGWLTNELKKNFQFVEACDDSEIFVKFAAANFPKINFKLADLQSPLPYEPECFDLVILNMVAPDLSDLLLTFQNIAKILKPQGELILTVPNPEFTYPKAEWKRGILDFLFGLKPKLKIKKSLVASGLISREFGQNSKIQSYYYNMPDYLNNAKTAGFALLFTEQIKPIKPSSDFDLNYQLSKYPLLLLLKFKKS